MNWLLARKGWQWNMGILEACSPIKLKTFSEFFLNFFKRGCPDTFLAKTLWPKVDNLELVLKELLLAVASPSPDDVFFEVYTCNLYRANCFFQEWWHLGLFEATACWNIIITNLTLPICEQNCDDVFTSFSNWKVRPMVSEMGWFWSHIKNMPGINSKSNFSLTWTKNSFPCFTLWQQFFPFYM